jgi:hypothetical protein
MTSVFSQTPTELSVAGQPDQQQPPEVVDDWQPEVQPSGPQHTTSSIQPQAQGQPEIDPQANESQEATEAQTDNALQNIPRPHHPPAGVPIAAVAYSPADYIAMRQQQSSFLTTDQSTQQQGTEFLPLSWPIDTQQSSVQAGPAMYWQTNSMVLPEGTPLAVDGSQMIQHSEQPTAPDQFLDYFPELWDEEFLL